MDERLARFLSEVEVGQVALFVASCVERASGVFFLAVASDEARQADSDSYLAFLDDLWRGFDLPQGDREEHRQQLGAYPELEGDEEPPGILAFAYDAVAAMYYGYSYLASGEIANVTYCSNHVLNSTGFIDDAVGAGEGHHESEVAAQLSDMDLLSGESVPEPEVVRTRSQTLGRDRVEALKKVFA